MLILHYSDGPDEGSCLCKSHTEGRSQTDVMTEAKAQEETRVLYCGIGR